MHFELVHQTGSRQRWKTAQTMTRASAALIADEISALAGVTGVRVNPRTGSVICTVESTASRALVARCLAGFATKPPMLRDVRRKLVEDAALARARKACSRARPGAGLVHLFAQGVRGMPIVRALLPSPGRTRASAASPHGEGQAQVPSSQTESGAKASSLGLIDLSPLVSWFTVRPFMPLAVNAINAVLGAVPVILKGVGELFRGKLNVEVLDAAAVAVSLLRRDFKTAGLVVLLLGLGELLESYTRKKSLESLADQLALKVDRVWVRRAGAVVEIALKDAAKDDVIVVRAGSTIPVDGKVVAGVGAVNQASMTGEPLAVHRAAGSVVFAGTVLEEGEIDIAPTEVGGGTRLAKIIDFIETSEEAKAGIQGRAERMADAIVPYNFALAALVFLMTRSLTRTAAVLLVDYSCALRLATPLAILTAMKEGAQKGMLVKGGRYLEALSEVDTVVFDKTGTLTQASPELTDVVPVDCSAEPDELLRLAACLEEHFPHPVSRSIVEAAARKGLYHADEVHDAKVRYIVAHGICSSVAGEKVVIGSRHFVEDDEGVDCSAAAAIVERLSREGKSILYMARAGVLAGVLGVRDPVRAEARQVVEDLKARGIGRIVMLTGDDQKTAAAVARELGVTEYRAQVLPEDKADYVTQLKNEGCRVLMVGDGINDSPALSAADVGATLREGSAIAQEVADVVLTRSTLADLPCAIDLSRAAMARIRQNFRVSVGMNTAFMGAGLAGLLTPAAGAVLHNLTTIGVCLNAMRSPLEERLDVAGALAHFRRFVIESEDDPVQGAVKAMAAHASQSLPQEA